MSSLEEEEYFVCGGERGGGVTKEGKFRGLVNNSCYVTTGERRKRHPYVAFPQMWSINMFNTGQKRSSVCVRESVRTPTNVIFSVVEEFPIPSFLRHLHKPLDCNHRFLYFILTLLGTGQRWLVGFCWLFSPTLFFRYIIENEGPRALFKGLGPNLVGVMPSRAIYFCSYQNAKGFFNSVLNPDSALVHVCSAFCAGRMTL